MLTAVQCLEWVTRSTTPPWRVGQLRVAFKADPRQAFSLRQALTGMQNQKCVLVFGVRDPALIVNSATFADLQANFNSSAPSRSTLVALSNLLSSQGASLNYLSNDWKLVGIVSPLTSLTGIRVLDVTAPTYEQDRQFAEQTLGTGEALVAVAEFGLAEAAGPVGWALILSGFVGLSTTNIMETVSPNEIPQAVVSSAGGDTGSGSGGDTLEIPTVTITGSYTGDPITLGTQIISAPPLTDGSIPANPSGSGNGGGNGGDDGDD
jgi:hypothetical protein